MEGTTERMVDGARVRLPARFREELGAGSLVVSKGLNACLFVHTAAGYERLIGALAAEPDQATRALRHFFQSGAMELDPDIRGRVSINRRLMEFAGILDRVVWRGEGNVLELWDRSRLDLYLASRDGPSALRGWLVAVESAEVEHP